MKIKFWCHQCLREHTPAGGGYVTFPFDITTALDLKDDYCYEFTCSQGHKNKFFLAVPKYALLFDMGMSAYLDGYYREATLDFAACIERFHEFCIYLMLWNDKSLQSDELTQLWNKMKQQSERQYGAFLALYYQRTGRLPQMLSTSMVEFRNNVTHKGAFPSKEQTFDYARKVADYIKDNVNRISSFYGFDIQGQYPAIKEAMKKGPNYISHMFPTIITQYSGGNSFEDSIRLFQGQFKNNYVK